MNKVRIGGSVKPCDPISLLGERGLIKSDGDRQVFYEVSAVIYPSIQGSVARELWSQFTEEGAEHAEDDVGESP